MSKIILVGREKRKGIWSSWWVTLITAIVFIFSVTVFFLVSPLLLEKGGIFVVGGPYEIETPSPPNGSWLWILSFNIMFLSLFYFTITAHHRGHDLLGSLMWPIFFFPVAWNLFDYALFKFDRVVWHYLVLGVAMVVCGVVLQVLNPVPSIHGVGWCKAIREAFRANKMTVILQLIGSAIGIYLGVFVFQRVVG